MRIRGGRPVGCPPSSCTGLLIGRAPNLAGEPSSLGPPFAGVPRLRFLPECRVCSAGPSAANSGRASSALHPFPDLAPVEIDYDHEREREWSAG